jgi:hypothetical protein
MPEARQNNSKLAEMLDTAASFSALVGMAVDVVSLFMALLSSVESAPEPIGSSNKQRRFSYFNIDRDNSALGSCLGSSGGMAPRGHPADMVHVMALQPFRQVVRDVGGAVV